MKLGEADINAKYGGMNPEVLEAVWSKGSDKFLSLAAKYNKSKEQAFDLLGPLMWILEASARRWSEDPNKYPDPGNAYDNIDVFIKLIDEKWSEEAPKSPEPETPKAPGFRKSKLGAIAEDAEIVPDDSRHMLLIDIFLQQNSPS